MSIRTSRSDGASKSSVFPGLASAAGVIPIVSSGLRCSRTVVGGLAGSETVSWTKFWPRVVKLALDEPDLWPREVAVGFTDTESYLVSAASIQRIINAQDVIASPAFIVLNTAEDIKEKTTALNQNWQIYLPEGNWQGWLTLLSAQDNFIHYVSWLGRRAPPRRPAMSSTRCVQDSEA